MTIDLITPLLPHLSFFATGLGLLSIGGLALLIILFWEWHFTLAGLFVIQLGVAVLATQIHALPPQWGTVQLMVSALAAAMLLLSARQVRQAHPQQRPGSFVIRFSAVTLLAVSWQFVDFDIALPLLTVPETDLFLWLILCAFVMLGLSDSPLYTAVALLLWLIPVQVFIQLILPEQRLFVFIGIAELLVALSCSYLLLAQRLPERTAHNVLTDITFPAETVNQLTGPTLPARQRERRRMLLKPAGSPAASAAQPDSTFSTSDPETNGRGATGEDAITGHPVTEHPVTEHPNTERSVTTRRPH